ncbi:hypothetical protein ACUXNR_002227 [Staphylococcus hominis]
MRLTAYYSSNIYRKKPSILMLGLIIKFIAEGEGFEPTQA